jgi:type IV pilus assembly protein PilQ
MLGFNTVRARSLIVVVGAGLAAMAIVACAASTTLRSNEPSSSIADVRVERDGEATAVTLLGVSDPIFTAFAQQNPERVVVDLASMRPDTLTDPLAVYDGLVEEVVLTPYSAGSGDPMTRVEVALAVPADYQVVPTDEGLMIRVEALPGMMAPDLPDAEPLAASELDPWEMVSESVSDPISEPESEMEPEAAPSVPATKLTDVDVREVGDGSIIHLRADGMVMSAESFTLESPERLVVDLPGLTSQVERERIPVGTPHAKQVRIGQHADMVRVVVDAGEASGAFQGRRVVPAPDGLVVALGSGEDLDWAVNELLAAPPAEGSGLAAELDETADETAAAGDWPAEPVEVAEADDADAMAAVEPMDESGALETQDAEASADEEPGSAPAETDDPAGPVTIYGIEYDAQDERDRVVVLGERPLDYLLFEPSPDTVVLSIQNAVIDPEVAVRITPEVAGPLSLVTAFEQPESEGSEVRVVMKRAPGLKPEISRRGSLVVLDFPRDGSVAARPPVLAAQTPAMPEAQPAAALAPTPAGSVVETSAVPSAPVAAVPAAIGATPSIDVLQQGGLTDEKQYAGRRISLDFKDIDMSDILRLIAEVSDLNVIAGEEVQGRVTIRLVDVPWDQALDVILLTKGLGFMRVGNVLRIAPADVLKQEEEMRLQERRALEQLEDLVVKLQPVNYASVSDIKGMVSRLLSPRGTVDLDKRTNTIIIKDIASVIDETTALIKAIDTQTPQVLIEAKIVEAALDFAREFGVTWGVGAQPLVDAFDDGSGARRDLGSDAFRLNTTDGSIGNNSSFINPLTASPTALFNVAGFILDEKLNLNLQLQAAEVNGDGKVISSPRVVTLDNRGATIEQGVSIPFQTFENGDAQLEFVDAVLKLDVTPHITADRSIIMQVKVSRNAPDDSVFTLTGSPAIAKNQVDTETLVKDGQTLVIGGIYVVQKGTRQSRVPYLHSLPMIGALFRSDEIRENRKELLIFVTPRVIATQQTAS